MASTARDGALCLRIHHRITNKGQTRISIFRYTKPAPNDRKQFPKCPDLAVSADVANSCQDVQKALYLLDASSKVSTWMCRFLVGHKTVSLLVQLLANPRLKVLEAALDILVYLVSGTELGMMALLAADGLAQLQAAALKESIPHLKETISTLLQSLQTQEAS